MNSVHREYVIKVLFLAVALLLQHPTPGRADFTAWMTIQTIMNGDTNQVGLITYVKDSWHRRELHGEGVLADFLGDHIEITDRIDGTRVRLFPESQEFSMDVVEHSTCGPFSIIDLNLLGRIRSRVRGVVVTPDTATVIHGCPAVPVEIQIASRYGGGTHIRFWICDEYQKTFGASVARDLNCGSSDSAQIQLGVQSAISSLKAQFRLSDPDAELLSRYVSGYPVRVESWSQVGGTTTSITRIYTDSLSSNPLPDSLFIAPLTYQKR